MDITICFCRLEVIHQVENLAAIIRRFICRAYARAYHQMYMVLLEDTFLDVKEYFELYVRFRSGGGELIAPLCPNYVTPSNQVCELFSITEFVAPVCALFV